MYSWPRVMMGWALLCLLTSLPSVLLPVSGSASSSSSANSQPQECTELNMNTHPHSLRVVDNTMFAEYAKQYDDFLVYIYAPWCGTARKFIPDTLVPLASGLQDHGIPTVVVNGACQVALKERLTKTIPALLHISRFVEDGQSNPVAVPVPTYGRSVSDLQELVLQMTKPIVTTLTTLQDATEQLPRIVDPIVVGYFSPSFSHGSRDHQAFRRSAARLRGQYRFFETFDTDISKAMNVRELPLIKVYNAGWQSVSLRPPFNDTLLTRWIKHHSHPLVLPLGEESMQRVERYGVPFLLVFVDIDHSSYRDIVNALKTVAPSYMNKISFVYADKDLFHSLGHRLGLSPTDTLSAVFIDPTTDSHYIAPAPPGLASLSHSPDLVNSLHFLVDEYLAGSIRKAKITGAHVPPIQPPLNPVCDIDGVTERGDENGEDSSTDTGSNPGGDDGVGLQPHHTPAHKRYTQEISASDLETYLHDNDQHLVLLMYTSWCAFCKAVLPIYDSLAKHYANDTRFVFARVNTDFNVVEEPAYMATHVPRLVFASKHSKRIPVAYSGDHTLPSLRTWLTSLVTDTQNAFASAPTTHPSTPTVQDGARNPLAHLSDAQREEIEKRIAGIREAYHVQSKGGAT